MSRSVDKRIVEMDLNNKNFESNAKTSISTIQKLKEALKMDGAEDGFYRVEKAASTVDLSPIMKSLDALNDKFSAFGIFGIEVLRNISNEAIQTGKQIWNATIGQIKSGGSARALNIANAQFKLEGMGVAWKEASKDISAAVDGTAYGFDAAANTASQLATAGIELGEAYGGMAHALKAVSGVAAMTNASYEEIGYIFSQIAAAGRLLGQDAAQISTRGINVTATLAKQLGKTTEEIKKMQEKGEISFAMFSEAMYEAFGEQAAKANNTFQGALSNVKAALSRIGEIWYGPFYNAAITPLNKIRVAINNIKKAFDDGDEATEDFKTRLTELMNIVSNIFSWLTENVNLTFFYNLADGCNKALDAINDIGHAIEKTLGIFKTDKQVEETENLTTSLKDLTEAELQAAKEIWNIGKYGNGQERIDNLLAAGFTEEGARRVQLAINQFIDSNYQWMEVEEKVATATEETKEETVSLADAITSKFVRSFVSARRTVSILGEAFRNVFDGVWNIIKLVGGSFAETFNFELIFKDVEGIAYRIRHLSERFKEFTTNNTKLKEVVDEVFKVLNDVYRVIRSIGSIGWTLITSAVQVFKELIKEIDIGEVSVSNITDKIATWAEKLALVIKSSGIFVKIFAKLVDYAKQFANYVKTIPEKLEPFFNKAKKNLDILLNKFKQVTGIDIASGVKKAIDIIKEFFRVLSDPFAKTGDGKTAIEAWAIDARDSILKVFGDPSSLFEKLKEWFRGGFEKVKSNPMSLVPKDLFSGLGKVLGGLVKFLDTMDIGKAIKVIRNMAGVAMVLAAVVTSLKLQKLLDTLQKPAESIKKIVGTFVGFIKNLQTLSERVTKAIEIDLMANAFLKFAAGIAIMAAAVVGLGLIDTKTLVKGLTALSICVIALAGSIALYNKTVNPASTKMFDTTMIQFGLAIAVMAAAVVKLGSMDYESLAKGVIMVDILTLLYDGMMVMNRVFRGGKNDIWKGIIAMALAMDALIPFIKVVGEMRSLDAIQGILALDVIFKELTAMTVAAALLSEKFESLDILGIVGSMSLLMLAINFTIPFLELIGRMSFGDFVQAVLGFGVILAAIGTTLVASSKAMSGLDTVDMAVIAAAIGIVALSLNALVPAIVALGAMEKVNEGSVYETISSLTTMLVGIGALLTFMSMLTVGTDVLLIAMSLSSVIIALNFLIPGFLALAACPVDDLVEVVVVLGALGLVFTTLLSVLAVVNEATAGGVLAIMAGFAVWLGEIAFTIIAGSVALGIAAAELGKAALRTSVAVDTFANIEGDKLTNNAKKLVKAIEIIAIGIKDTAPTISMAIQSLMIGLISGFTLGLYNAMPVISKVCNAAVNFIAKTLIGNVVNLIMGLVEGVIEGIVAFAEWLTDESGGVAMLERGMNALIDAIIISLDVLTDRMDEIATWIADFVIAVVRAVTKVLNEKGDEFNDAWEEFMEAVGGYIYSASEHLKDAMFKAGGKLLGYIWDGIKDKWNKTQDEIRIWWIGVRGSLKIMFGINEGDSTGTIWYKAGSTIVKSILKGIFDGFKNYWQFGINIGEAIYDFVDAMKQDLLGGVAKNEQATREALADYYNDINKGALADGMGIQSPSTDMWEAGKNLLLGLVNGVKDNLGMSELSLGNLFSDIKDSLLGDLGIDSESGESFMSKLMGELGIDDENTFSISPVLDTSDFEKQYSSFSNDYGLDTNYNFDTSSDLASDVSLQTQGGISSSGFTSENVEGLRTDVQDIAERIGRLEVRMDTGALVGALYAGIDEKLGEKQILAGRGVYA